MGFEITCNKRQINKRPLKPAEDQDPRNLEKDPKWNEAVAAQPCTNLLAKTKSENPGFLPCSHLGRQHIPRRVFYPGTVNQGRYAVKR